MVSLVSRVWRSTELRAERIEFDDTAHKFIAEAMPSGGTAHHRQQAPGRRRTELANLAGDTPEEIIAAADRGIQRIRATPQLPCSFLRHGGLSPWSEPRRWRRRASSASPHAGSL